MLSRLLALPQLRDLDLDDPQTSRVVRRIVREKPFLSSVYRSWYTSLLSQVNPQSSRILEIGSGTGFLKDHLPHMIASDIQPLPWVDTVLDAPALPFSDGSLEALVMTNVLHHVPNPSIFLEEAARCLRPGGRVVMIEPWVTPWSRFIYRNFHHEPFDPDADSWELPRGGPLSTANGALPWILFERDQVAFTARYPSWEILEVRLTTPLTYLLSGGVSMRSLAPAWSFGFWSGFEKLLTPILSLCAMFARITLVRRNETPAPMHVRD